MSAFVGSLTTEAAFLVGGVGRLYLQQSARPLWSRPSYVSRPRLHAANPISRELTLRDLARKPTIYLIPECDTDVDIAKVLHELCEEIFEEQLAGWYTETSTRPQDRSYDVFCHGFDYQHHSMLVDLCDEPLIHD